MYIGSVYHSVVVVVVLLVVTAPSPDVDDVSWAEAAKENNRVSAKAIRVLSLLFKIAVVSII